MEILLIIQLVIALMFLVLGWAIRQKGAYWLISGFTNRPKEEQQQLINNGYPQKTGLLVMSAGIGMVLLLPLFFTSFTYSLEVQFGFMLVFLLGGMVYLSKFEVPRKRKRSYIISTSLFVVTIAFIVGLYSLGYQEYELIAKDDSFEITGMYGETWLYSEIKEVELLEDMPEVTYKVNGFGLSTLSKGVFKVSDFGNSLLFIQKGSAPYLHIELKDETIFINSKNPEQTKKWLDSIESKLENRN